jgi:hypothetical protein
MRLILCAAALIVLPRLHSQGTLADAARRAESAWQSHDADGLVGRSPAVVLQLPGADPSAALGRAQAIQLLRRHFQSATERRVAVGAITEREPGRGVVELDRVYVVRGTADERHETVFLGFQRLNEQWLLVEIRTAQ